ncbi:MAG: hypothetical protein HUK21_05780 [Fibrobacteraceae bacterium]|nr:hypothetical protein [Fibrobacteraceae bacterium]
MAEIIDFSELRNYLQGQMDLGETELFLDDPWALSTTPKPAVAPVPRSVLSPSVAATTNFEDTSNPEVSKVEVALSPLSASMPAPRSVKKVISAYESSSSLADFYSAIALEKLYSNAGNLATYVGPEHPKLLLLLASSAMVPDPMGFLQSSTGEMVAKLFASLKIPAESIGVTYFYKGSNPFKSSPLLETSLRKMLTKELSFIAPDIMVTCGETLFYQVFGKAKSFNEQAGAPLTFAGIKSTAFLDLFEMEKNVELKKITWKVHVPRSGYFSN